MREGGAAREAGHVGELLEGEVEAGELGHVEERGGDGLLGLERPRVVDEEELLDALVGEELEPAHELGPVLIHVAAGEADAAERARVRGEDAGNCGGNDTGAGAVEVVGDHVLASVGYS